MVGTLAVRHRPRADEPGQKRSKSAGSFEQEPPRRSLDYVLQRAGAVQPCYWYIHAEAVRIMLGYASTQEMEDELGGALANGWDGTDAWISRHGDVDLGDHLVAVEPRVPEQSGHVLGHVAAPFGRHARPSEEGVLRVSTSQS
jgi:hypothetical protein